jgi:hypothetical protein
MVVIALKEKNMSNGLPVIWAKRWEKLDRQLELMRSEFQYWIDRGEPRMKTLEVCVDSLKVFAQTQINYFATQFENPEEVDKRFPVPYVYATILDQVGFDLLVLHQAAMQRTSGSKAMKDALYIADKIAFAALSPVTLSPAITVVTYITKSPLIRVIPYASVAFIGIPFTCVTSNSAPYDELTLPDVFSAQDFLAIPHEIGHFLFWHGSNETGTLVHQYFRTKFNNKTLAKEQRKYYRWSEEVFADIYGCLVAGAVIALDFQDLQLRKQQEAFLEDDGAHPQPILRPGIYNRVLREKESPLASKLKEKWDIELNALFGRGGNASVLIQQIAGNKDGLVLVDDVVQFALDYLNPRIPTEKIQWWNTDQGTVPVEDLYTTFQSQFKKDVIDALKLQDLKEEDKIDADYVMSLQSRWLEQPGGMPVNAPKWLPVLEAGGWATKGPQCEGPGVCTG